MRWLLVVLGLMLPCACGVKAPPKPPVTQPHSRPAPKPATQPAP